jgi:hypothetical protein
MSGGHFDYVQGRIRMVADEVAYEIENNTLKDDGYVNNFSEETLEKFKECEKVLRKAAAMLERVDYLISSDDAEETFHERWKKDLECL